MRMRLSTMRMRESPVRVSVLVGMRVIVTGVIAMIRGDDDGRARLT